MFAIVRGLWFCRELGRKKFLRNALHARVIVRKDMRV